MIVESIADTLIKTKLQDSQTLAKSDLVMIPKGGKYEADSIEPVRFDHVKIKFKKSLLGLTGKEISEGYIYIHHWKLPAPPIIKLNVKYFTQVDNDTDYFGAGWRQCNLTSCAMWAEFLLEKFGQKTLSQRAIEAGMSEPESYYGKILNQYGDTIDHGANTAALEDLGIQSYFTYSLDIPEAIAAIQAGYPVVVGVEYKASGHMIVLVGCDFVRRQFYVHDPYGARAGSEDWYATIGSGGEYDVYSIETMQRIWGGNGWGRIATQVAGKSTNLPTNW